MKSSRIVAPAAHAAGVIAAALALAGCGGSSGAERAPSLASATGSTPGVSTAARGGGSPPLSRSQLIARADAICRRVNGEIAASPARDASDTETIRVVPGHGVLEQRAASELSTLTPPAALEGDWRLMLGYVRTLASELAVLVHDAASSNAAGIAALASSKRRTHAALAAASGRIGVRDCGTLGLATSKH